MLVIYLFLMRLNVNDEFRFLFTDKVTGSHFTYILTCSFKFLLIPVPSLICILYVIFSQLLTHINCLFSCNYTIFLILKYRLETFQFFLTQLFINELIDERQLCLFYVVHDGFLNVKNMLHLLYPSHTFLFEYFC